jgi:hypothetical protein
MSAHLSDEQFTRYLSGEEDGRAQFHLAECEGCRAQAARLLEIVGTARAHGERSGERHANLWARQRNEVLDALAGRRPHRPTWALASAMAVLVFLSTFLFQNQSPRTQSKSDMQVSHPGSISDDALLSAVNSTLEQDVPSALAPVQQLAFEREQAEQNGSQKN